MARNDALRSQREEAPPESRTGRYSSRPRLRNSSTTPTTTPKVAPAYPMNQNSQDVLFTEERGNI